MSAVTLAGSAAAPAAPGWPLALPQSSELSDAVREQLARRPPVNLYRMVAHSPALLEPFMTLVLTNFNALSLDPALREAVILRVGARTGSHYELHHHRPMAARAGLPDAAAADIVALADASPHWDATLTDALALADLLLRGEPMGDPTRAGIHQPLVQRLVAGLGTRGYVELSMLVGFYRMVAMFLDATGVPVESGVTTRA